MKFRSSAKTENTRSCRKNYMKSDLHSPGYCTMCLPLSKTHPPFGMRGCQYCFVGVAITVQASTARMLLRKCMQHGQIYYTDGSLGEPSPKFYYPSNEARNHPISMRLRFPSPPMNNTPSRRPVYIYAGATLLRCTNVWI